MKLQEIENRIKELGEQSVKLQLEACKLKELLEAQKPKEKAYTWEECFQRKGFYWAGKSIIEVIRAELSISESNTNVASIERVIKSNDAACKLSHIIEAINKDYDEGCEISFLVDRLGEIEESELYAWDLPYLKSYKGARILTQHHEPLLLQYFGVEEK